ncbi:MAG: CheR family methyltransferase [Gemmatimonadaceae bacterium]
MIEQVERTNVERFRAVIAQRLGLSFDDSNAGLLSDVLRRRAAAASLRAEAYVAALEREPSPAEAGALAQELTVAETYFFRNRDQYRALAEVAIPERLAARPRERVLRILSAGCASGEEAYTLAMVARDAVDRSCEVSIVGIDANPAAISRAGSATYTAWALRETSPLEQQRWFRPAGRDFILDDRVRTAVRFEVRNIFDDDSRFWRPDSLDIVFFRNVLMYFTPEQARAAVARVAGALAPGGYLFLGHAETLRGLSGDFSLEHTHETFYYRRKDQMGHAVPVALRAEATSVGASSAPREPVSGTAWFDAIGAATRRIESLTSAAPAPRWSLAADGAAVAPTGAAAWDRTQTLELLREERFAEALATMPAVSVESERDPDVMLLRAALYVHRGELGAAENTCRLLLDLDALSAGAHYLLALCRDGADDPLRAAHHDQAAAYLDPEFAMPPLHLGLMAVRSGDRDVAQRELSRALPLLEREDASRLLLYGGGFSREALLALCRTELAGAGGRS